MPSKNEYLEYLMEKGMSESDVLPVLDKDFKDDFRKAMSNPDLMSSIVSAALQASKGDENSLKELDKLKIVLELANENANDFINKVIKNNLHQHCEMAGIYLPENIYVGIFPISSYNAHIVRRNEGFLALINTGYIELIESIIEVSSYEINIKAKAKIIAEWLTNYLTNSKIPTIHERQHLFNLYKTGKDNGLNSYLTTATEEFILLHEYGHCYLNHFDERADLNENVIYSYRKEYEADLWALKIQIEKSYKLADEYMSAIKIYGFYVFLGIGALIEKFQTEKLGLNKTTTHPTAVDRIWNLEAFLKSINKLDDIYLGTKFLKVLDETSIFLLGDNITDSIPVLKTEIIKIIQDFEIKQKLQNANLNWANKIIKKYEAQIGNRNWTMYIDGNVVFD